MPLGSACVAQTTPDMGHIGLRIGVMMAISSVGALGGGPLSGIIKQHAGWVCVHLFTATVCILGSACLFAVKVIWVPEEKTNLACAFLTRRKMGWLASRL